MKMLVLGAPRRLVTDTVRTVCVAISALQPATPVRVVLMNTTGNRNPDAAEQPPLSQRIVVFVVRWLLPPHLDNEEAARYLRVGVGQHNAHIEWVAVRPDGLIDEAEVSDYDLHRSPIRSVIFNAGSTSRINVAHCMAELGVGGALWQSWKGQMPVIYNRG
ncbi:MAG: hypothetical protein AAF458_15565 [Pseudomonadota bacterium]